MEDGCDFPQMGASGIMMRTQKRAWLCFGVAAGLSIGLAGCARPAPSNVVIQDNGLAELQEAERLSQEAFKAQKAGKSEQAIQLYQESLNHAQELYGVWNNLGLLLLEKGDRMQAVTMFNRAAELAPDKAEPYYNAGWVYMDNAQPEKALDYFKKALARQPRYLESLRGSARVGRILAVADEEALERMKTAIMIEKDPAWRRIFEEEKYRIDGALQTAGRSGKF